MVRVQEVRVPAYGSGDVLALPRAAGNSMRGFVAWGWPGAAGRLPFHATEPEARRDGCAMSIRDAVQALGIEVRAGLHTGECEVRGDDIGGISVHIGARVSALAGPNEVLVSSTLRDLVIGSGLEFEDRGAHELKGVPGECTSSPSLLRREETVWPEPN
jgi:class 3 adenylate cyclase